MALRNVRNAPDCRAFRLFIALVLSAFLVSVQPGSTWADDGQAEAGGEEQRPKKGKRCDFSRAEKFGMFFWLIPIAGGIYTPFACKRDVFAGGERTGG